MRRAETGSEGAGTGAPLHMGESLNAVAVLHCAVWSFIVAIVAAVFGFGGLPGDAAGIARIVSFVFLLVSAVMIVLGLLGRRQD
jgi:uncharacterized membrane protein YtjA (UPF0391 family)